VAAERVLAAVHQVSPASGRGKVIAHCSAGLCSTQGGAASFGAEELVKRADEALYEAKRAGGRRLCTRTLPG
jgi:GGDEF domain-containing protein